MEQISEHLTWIEDTCSVYLIRQGDAGLLIDCGTDFMPADLRGSPVRRVERLLLTHFHRDQSANARLWQKQGTEVAMPFVEKKFIQEANLSRAAYDIYNNYRSYYQTFSPLRDTPADLLAHDYEVLNWRDLSFEVVPLPGHTFGSVGYLFQLDGRRMLACGDLMSGPGQVNAYYPVQWGYMEFQGHAHLLESLKSVCHLEVDLILPGHGRPFPATEEAINSLIERLERVYELFFRRPYVYFKPEFRQVSPHVYEVSNAEARSYLVTDGAGHALMIDSGYVSNAPIAQNPHRYIDNLTPYLEGELGIKRVEWFLPSHYHDDHLAGYPRLKNRYGTKVACSPEVKDILENPQNYDMPCLLPIPIRVDHVIERGRPFEWRGIEFYMEQQPGQTLYHHLIWFQVDGQKFLSIGDDVSGLSFREQRDYIFSFIPKNRTPVSGYAEMPRQIMALSPDVLLTGHGGAVRYDPETMERWQKWMEEWQHVFTEMQAQPHPNYGMDPRWIEFYPYKVRVQPGETVNFRLLITNHEPEERACHIRFRAVEGIELVPEEMALNVPGSGKAEREVTATFPDLFETHSLTIVADVTWNGRRLGEIAEAVAYW